MTMMMKKTVGKEFKIYPLEFIIGRAKFRKEISKIIKEKKKFARMRGNKKNQAFWKK
jgi:hypothetical protein